MAQGPALAAHPRSRHYAAAERLLQHEPAALALFLADHDRNIPRAVEVATAAVAIRQDIFTEDSLAWALFKAGRRAEALATNQHALRTGSRDRRLLAHAAAIHLANGYTNAARGFAAGALDGLEGFDLVAAIKGQRSKGKG